MEDNETHCWSGWRAAVTAHLSRFLPAFRLYIYIYIQTWLFSFALITRLFFFFLQHERPNSFSYTSYLFDRLEPLDDPIGYVHEAFDWTRD